MMSSTKLNKICIQNQIFGSQGKKTKNNLGRQWELPDLSKTLPRSFSTQICFIWNPDFWAIMSPYSWSKTCLWGWKFNLSITVESYLKNITAFLKWWELSSEALKGSFGMENEDHLIATILLHNFLSVRRL